MTRLPSNLRHCTIELEGSRKALIDMPREEIQFLVKWLRAQFDLWRELRLQMAKLGEEQAPAHRVAEIRELEGRIVSCAASLGVAPPRSMQVLLPELAETYRSAPSASRLLEGEPDQAVDWLLRRSQPSPDQDPAPASVVPPSNRSGRASIAGPVFVSYSHDTPQHKKRVLDFANRLKADGVVVWMDAFEPHPSVGWPRWMTTHMREARFVLVVCTEEYKSSFEGERQPRKRKGSTWEGFIAQQILYEQGTVNEKFIPVRFSDDEEVVPLPLQAFTDYKLLREYDALRLHLAQ